MAIGNTSLMLFVNNKHRHVLVFNTCVVNTPPPSALVGAPPPNPRVFDDLPP